METFTNEQQWISLEIASAFRKYLKGSRYTVRQNLDVWTGGMVFPEASSKDADSVTRPDVLIYSPKEQRQDGIIRSPQLVVEIWPPEAGIREHGKKLAEYYNIGVKEFWQIFYEQQEFVIISCADGDFEHLSDGTFHEPLASSYFPSLKVDLSEYYNEFG